MASNPISKLSEDEYLALERAAEFRSEFVDGEMFAMSGASMPHIRIQQNLAGELYNALRGRPREALGTDFRIKVSSRAYFYADNSVACNPASDSSLEDNLINPVVIFEILSASTEKFDRGLKFHRYRTLGSLQDYVLVSQEEYLIERYTRQPDGSWSR